MRKFDGLATLVRSYNPKIKINTKHCEICGVLVKGKKKYCKPCSADKNDGNRRKYETSN